MKSNKGKHNESHIKSITFIILYTDDCRNGTIINNLHCTLYVLYIYNANGYIHTVGFKI